MASPWPGGTSSSDLNDILSFAAEMLTGASPDAAWRQRLLASLGPKATSDPDTVRAGVALVLASPVVHMA